MKRHHIILASNSPRRRELLGGLGLEFEVRVLPDIEEIYPDDLPVERIAEYIATEKAQAYLPTLKPDDLVITADTVVIAQGQVLGKPVDEADARRMLRLISGRTHQVTTGVCLSFLSEGQAEPAQKSFSVTTDVTFKELTDEEISYYITHYRPFDKAGAYGIQEWIGYVGVTSLRGSYFNVMGLPVQRIYTELSNL